MRSSAYDAIWVNTPHLDLEQLAFAPLFGAVFPRATTAPPYTLLPIVQQQFLFSLPTHQSNKVESVTKPKQWPTFSITWTKKKKKRKKYHCNSPFTPPPPNTTSPHPYTHLPAISTWLIVRFPVTQKQSGTSLLFFRWPNAFWIWCFKGKDSSLFTGCKMLSITKRPWGQQRNTACEVPANTPSNQRCDPQSSYKTSSSVSPWLCVWQV